MSKITPRPTASSDDCANGACPIEFGEGVDDKKILGDEKAQKVIYGEDDRKDLYQVKDDDLRKVAKSAFTLVDAVDLERQGDIVRLNTSSVNLCASEPFASQETLGWCSGTLIGKNRDLLLTAGHCISKGDEENVKMVLDFDVSDANNPTSPSELPASSVYGVKEVLYSVIDQETGADWALVRLERSVDDRDSVPLAEPDSVRVGDELVMIGYPTGLPNKVEDGAEAMDVSPEGYFKANLDAYGGNSGSMVINGDGEIVGILVRGSQDYNYENGCMVSNRLPNSAGAEDSTKISELIYEKVRRAERGQLLVKPLIGVAPGLKEINQNLYAQAWRMIQDANRAVETPGVSAYEDREFITSDELASLPEIFQRAGASIEMGSDEIDPRGIRARDLAKIVARRTKSKIINTLDPEAIFLGRANFEALQDPAVQTMVRWAVEDTYGEAQARVVYGEQP